MTPIAGCVIRLGLMTRLLPDRANCPLLVKAELFKVMLAIPFTGTPVGTV